MSMECKQAESETEVDIVRIHKLPVSKVGFVIYFQFRDCVVAQKSFEKGEDFLWAIEGEQLPRATPLKIAEVVPGKKIVQSNGSNGLLLCFNENDCNYYSLWNPATGTLGRRLPRCIYVFPDFEGFGFDPHPTRPSYVIVRGFENYPTNSYVKKRNSAHELVLHVYRFQSHKPKPKWVMIIIRQSPHDYVTPQGSATFSNGVFYWYCDPHVFAFKPPYNKNSWEIIDDPLPPDEYPQTLDDGTLSLTGCDGRVVIVFQSEDTFLMWQLTAEYQWHILCELERTQFGEPGENYDLLQVAVRPTGDFLVISMSERKMWFCNSAGTLMRVIDFTGKLPSQEPHSVYVFDFETTATAVSKL